ncbi:dCMP deaminase family protein [Magnetospira sp. QH-2]|uniref:deoxycytidylate deaminase n=1 Tax=Magnetospira sp. (strain QH-2) TaxID=1288970 RepID=UPI0003E80B08|nr:dCMP deaminase family protein [Magnetospira sp. QH-2]CCQ73736.1 Deoxycytidylate deaminase [Magnetospira sp. QH-2]
MSDKWHDRFLRLAHEVASWSKDRSTQVGAVLIRDDRTPITFAYNGFPRNIDDMVEERHERPTKYQWTSHAEENAICNAARMGASTHGSTLYVTHYPCCGCARKIIQAGISRVVVDGATMDGPFMERWEADIKTSDTMFEEAGVSVVVATHAKTD